MEENGTIDAELATYPVPSHRSARDELEANPEQNMESLASHIAEGGCIVDWAQSRGLMVHAVTMWIDRDAERSRKMQRAWQWRDEWVRQKLLGTLRDLAFCDISQAYEEDGSVKPFDKWPLAAKRAISGIQVDELWEGKGEDKRQVGITKKLKFVDKIKATELLMKNLGMLIDVVRVDQTLRVDPKDVEELKKLPKEDLTDMLLGRK